MRIAMVTGVAGGIGSATAKLLLENDTAVVGMDVADAAPAGLSGNGNFTYFKGGCDELARPSDGACEAGRGRAT